MLALVRGPAARRTTSGSTAALDVLERAARRARDAACAGATARRGSRRLCMAGVDFPDEEQRAAGGGSTRAAGPSAPSVGNDTFAVLRAGTDRGWGVAVVCGAGINCVGVAPDGREARFPALGRDHRRLGRRLRRRHGGARRRRAQRGRPRPAHDASSTRCRRTSASTRRSTSPRRSTSASSRAAASIELRAGRVRRGGRRRRRGSDRRAPRRRDRGVRARGAAAARPDARSRSTSCSGGGTRPRADDRGCSAPIEAEPRTRSAPTSTIAPTSSRRRCSAPRCSALDELGAAPRRRSERVASIELCN